MSIKFNHKTLKKLLLEALIDINVPNNVSIPLVDSLIETSLRGVDSHGINLFPVYYKFLNRGRINKNPQLKITQTGLSTTTIDADNGFGYYAGSKAMDRAIDMASETGVGVVTVKNSNHFGAASYFTHKAANKGMIGFAFTNTEPLVNAFNSTEAFLGTNPFCFSAPMDKEEPFCLDMATSTVAWNKIKNYQRENQTLSQGWALDNKGNETLNPHDAHSLTAIGGYKGFGLGMMIEILCSGLTDSTLGVDIHSMHDIENPNERKISHFFLVIDIEKFINLDIFKKYMSTLSTRVRNLPSSKEEKVLMAGDKEKENFKQRVIKGIPVDEIKFQEFLDISPKFKQSIL